MNASPTFRKKTDASSGVELVRPAPPKRQSRRDLEVAARVDGRVQLRLLTTSGDPVDDHDELAAMRPKTRGDCINGPRPCPWVSCRHNLFLDADHPEHGGLQINWPDREPHEIDPARSCALDVAEQGGASLEDIGDAMNTTRETVRQIEDGAFDYIVRSSYAKRRAATVLREHDSEERLAPSRSRVCKMELASERPVASEVEDEEDEPEEQIGHISFFADCDDADERVADSVWGMFARKQSIKSEHSKRATAQRLRKMAMRSKMTPGDR